MLRKVSVIASTAKQSSYVRQCRHVSGLLRRALRGALRNDKRKLALLLLISFVTSLFSFFVPVFAAEEKDLVKVYNTEIIGAGELVYHITACDKKLSYAPLRCSEELVTKFPAYKSQCPKKDKYKTGTPVQGCIRKNPDKSEVIDEMSGMPAVDPFDLTSCKDKLEDMGYHYVREYAIVKAVAGTNLDPNTPVLATIAWPNNNIPGTLLEQIVSYTVGGANAYSVPLYRTRLCVTWDVLETDSATKWEDSTATDLTGELKTLYGVVHTNAEKLILPENGGCNNDNSTQTIGGRRSTPFNDFPSFTCSIKERISGTSGIDIIAKYVHAIYVWAAGLVGIVAVFTMVYSGIEISMAGGDSAKYESAKKRIMDSIMGLAILFLSGLILYTINPGFFTG